jgi:protein-tyrosine phosphatase
MDAIDFSNLLENTKKKINLESKQIKKISFYNYLNDNIPNIIIDCRVNFPEHQLKEGGFIRESYTIKNMPNIDDSNIKPGSRIILIMDDNQDLKISEELEVVRKYITSEDKIEKGIFVIKNSDFQEFLKDYYFFTVNENSDTITKNLAETRYPLIVQDKFIYTGNFFNSKNIYQCKNLKIGSVISLLNEEDQQLKKISPNTHFFPTDEQGHSEVDFSEIIDIIDMEKEKGKTPILIYCFSGQSLSLAVCIAYLMKTKKWSLQFATGYMMKICPHFNIPAWLYTQLQRFEYQKPEPKNNTNTNINIV